MIVDLCRTLHLWPVEIDLATQRGRCHLAAGVRRALRAQRCRARAGHWSYDIACHARLLELHRRIVALQKTPCRLCRGAGAIQGTSRLKRSKRP